LTAETCGFPKKWRKTATFMVIFELTGARIAGIAAFLRMAEIQRATGGADGPFRSGF
jgi:hypothetical protein